MIEIDGSLFSGSGTIVRQAVALAALTGKPVHIINARVRRPKPGLRPQHVRVVEAICELVGGRTEGVEVGSQEIVFRPGQARGGRSYMWDIGSAGSTTMLGLALLPVLAFGRAGAEVELKGGLFQDFAPSFYHLERVLLPLLGTMGLNGRAKMVRPGYVPTGGGILRLQVEPVAGRLSPLILQEGAGVERVWGVALASHLEERKVSHRMAEAAIGIFERGGYRADIEICYDTSALQPGAAFAAFADLASGSRLGADRAGAPGRRAEAIGRQVAAELIGELRAGASVDRFAADQMILFAALAAGESRFRTSQITEHVHTSAWLAKEFLETEITIEEKTLAVKGVGFSKAGA